MPQLNGYFGEAISEKRGILFHTLITVQWIPLMGLNELI